MVIMITSMVIYIPINNELSVGLWFKSNQMGQDYKLIYTGSWVNFIN